MKIKFINGTVNNFNMKNKGVKYYENRKTNERHSFRQRAKKH